MKTLLLVTLATTAISVSALDIKTNDGKVYKNVHVSSITPIGFDISYTDKDDNMLMRGLKFTEVSKKIQKEFNYKPQKAIAFKKKIKLYRAKQIKHRLAEIKAGGSNAFLNDYEHIKAMVYGKRMNQVLLHIIRETHGGVIADVKSEHATLTSGQYGRVYVSGVHGGNGASWNGNIYPTGRHVRVSSGSYPAYSSSLDMATISVRNLIQQRARAKKKKK